jgi:hypothetical protein
MSGFMDDDQAQENAEERRDVMEEYVQVASRG